MEERQRRDLELVLSSARLQCLCCRSEFKLQGKAEQQDGGERVKRSLAVMLPEDEEGQDGEGLMHTGKNVNTLICYFSSLLKVVVSDASKLLITF